MSLNEDDSAEDDEVDSQMKSSYNQDDIYSENKLRTSM